MDCKFFASEADPLLLSASICKPWVCQNLIHVIRASTSTTIILLMKSFASSEMPVHLGIGNVNCAFITFSIELEAISSGNGGNPQSVMYAIIPKLQTSILTPYG